MGRLTGKVIEASAATEMRQGHAAGIDLRRLRLLSGLTQAEMAARMNVQQAAISKLEKGGEVYLSTVQRYVEALGASLRVDAVFPADARIVLRIREGFELEYGHDDQLVFPILADEPFRAQRDVVLSIRPQYSEKILDGQKTVELRRRFPVSAPSGTVAYIYSTSPVRAIVGIAEIRDVLKLPVKQIWSEFEDAASIERGDFDNYFQGVDFGFVLMFEDVKPFSRPVPLSELREKYGFEPPQSFLYASRDLRKALRDEATVVSH
ncbi:putative transcriptional regulator/DNA-binding XRE family transcriptional regulator [Peteryoungia aggregata LMG 23059]|uniref:Transcriptional regulator/DNA-binding XRE family transcriptional regulator n=1 Tax=Peteryoungia aggregata LMG 23059 TaxID=1368425 RepID=A0ABU0GCD9_9HYPH|nr:helix-turn-helix domain-containing protein [Peteryoungia aggregata]MDQ0422997.1 putative transcriptional regulator/DNA-binding XRE family transcriptional regulator [Peteryoungia aggregata LMG 23059]